MARAKNRGYQQTFPPTYTIRRWKMGGYIRLSREDLQKINRGLDDSNSVKITCVVVKDLSRFARNYGDAGSLIDDLFVQTGVRFISLAEGVDSYKNPDGVNSIPALLSYLFILPFHKRFPFPACI